jgi:hypothetical protein
MITMGEALAAVKALSSTVSGAKTPSQTVVGYPSGETYCAAL